MQWFFHECLLNFTQSPPSIEGYEMFNIIFALDEHQHASNEVFVEPPNDSWGRKWGTHSLLIHFLFLMHDASTSTQFPVFQLFWLMPQRHCRRRQEKTFPLSFEHDIELKFACEDIEKCSTFDTWRFPTFFLFCCSSLMMSERRGFAAQKNLGKVSFDFPFSYSNMFNMTTNDNDTLEWEWKKHKQTEEEYMAQVSCIKHEKQTFAESPCLPLEHAPQ